MISLYSRLITDFETIQIVIKKLFPDDKSELIEQGTVFLSEGDVFDCSVEPLFGKHSNHFYLSASYNGSNESHELFLSDLIAALDANGVVYSVDSEFQKDDGGYYENNIRHPDFDRLIHPTEEDTN
jgi:hypothetical protein